MSTRALQILITVATFALVGLAEYQGYAFLRFAAGFAAGFLIGAERYAKS